MNAARSFADSRLAAGFTLSDVASEFGVEREDVQSWDVGKAKAPDHIIRSLEFIGRYQVEQSAARKQPMPIEMKTNSEIHSASRDVEPPQKQGHMKGQSTAPSTDLIKSKRRVADHGEVFTPPWLVEKMLDLVKGETERIDSRFLEPACGSGNFLVPVLQRKLAAVDAKYGKSAFEKKHYALLALTSLYGIELLADNIAECRANMLAVFAEYLGLDDADELYRAASHILSLNLIHGDAMTMKGADGDPIVVVEWAYLGKGKFNRRDFRLDVLTGMSKFKEERSLFSGLGSHEIFQPTESYPPMAVRDLAARDKWGAE